jgi:hydroxyquinol 1,2-dioxygenase
VRDLDGRPVPGALLDVWQADAEGAYEAQLDVDEARLRARFRSREDGGYCVRTIAPKGYTIPMDGTVGDLISRTEISEYRPAHVHFRVDAAGFEPLVTHLFRHGAPYLDTDVVFGTKQQLVVPFDRHERSVTPAGVEPDRPWLEARYDFVLQPRRPSHEGADEPAREQVDGSVHGRR